MITRRNILKLFGFGGAAAAVAPAVAKAASEPEPLALKPMEADYSKPWIDTRAEVKPTLVMCRPDQEKRAREVLESAGAHVMPRLNVRAHDEATPALRKVLGTLESIEPDGTAWVRVGGRPLIDTGEYRFCSPRFVCNSEQCGKPIPHDVHDGCILDRAGWYGLDDEDA